MIVRVHGFDWIVYTERIMPAFKDWLVDGNEQNLYQLYKETHHAELEQHIPDAMQRLRLWPQAQDYIKKLPRGPHMMREYQKLCIAEQFTALSDQYMYRHPPQLYQNTDTLRTLWSALIEAYCLPWFQVTDEEGLEEMEGKKAKEHKETKGHTPLHQQVAAQRASSLPGSSRRTGATTPVTRNDMINLLHAANLNELAEAIHALPGDTAEHKEEQDERDERDENMHNGDNNEEQERASVRREHNTEEEVIGISLGRHPTTLQLRGWLATTSVYAMALFELLACGRRRMPFGYNASDLSKSYIGYLTPEETWQLAVCIREIAIPQRAEAEEQYRRFRTQTNGILESFRVIDEVQPAHAQAFVRVVRIAALQGLGLLCSVG